jgi:hypothetical protein
VTVAGCRLLVAGERPSWLLGSRDRDRQRLLRTGTCIARYGIVTDRDTGEPIDGVDVFLGANPGYHATTDLTGWYLVNAGCPAGGIIGFNTTLIYFSRPGYADGSRVVGRGLSGFQRLDWSISRTEKTGPFGP